ncbi:Inosine-uridine nucleoside N-ribohydrolase [Propionibacterium cyclohexanicum]|uniref:Inosine-uridine nucleoside N-ribohydrolase n=1 Tax=Propionibacterium cyclohexanicum TaxID=64702 RepID=A0A1H9RT72_9ACTN|nr:nucleoside hydrolase [Propionibacterium cyclohexanicum]SER75837.1 Inosine-uridine nucleoside N-ribohydrolase [Propionibacterium cyclohexanicum]
MRIIADVDTGIDDALALVQLASRPDVELVGVSASTGNTTARAAARNSAGVLAVCGRAEVPVYTGAGAPLVVPATTTPETHGSAGLGYARLPGDLTSLRSGDFLEELWLPELRSHPGATTLLVTGPLTDLALALRAEPELPRLAAQVVIMGGSFNHPGNTTPTAEWNSWCDPHAAAEVYRAYEGMPTQRLPLVCSLGVTEQIELKPDDLDRLATAAGALAPQLSPELARNRPPSDTSSALIDLLADALRFYFEFHADWGYGYLAQVHDLLAAEIALGEVPYHATATWVGVETGSELTRGTTVADLRNLWHRPANARIVDHVAPGVSLAAFTAAIQRLTH